MNWHKIAKEFQASGRLDEAENAYLESLKLCPKNVDSINNLSIVMRKKNEIRKAEELLKKGLEILEELWWQKTNQDEEVVICRQYARIINSYSILAIQKKKFDLSIKLSKQQILLEPNGTAYVNLGVAMGALGLHNKAELSHVASLTRYNLVANDAIELMGKKLDTSLESTRLHIDLCNIATTRLQQEPLRTINWKLLLSRLGSSEDAWRPAKRPWKNLWNGDTCNELVIWDEMGYGDAMQCLRWIDEAASRTKELVLVLRKPLISLITKRLELPRNCKIIELKPRTLEMINSKNNCPLMGLPVALAGDNENIPMPKPRENSWLKCKVKERERRIGIVWRAGDKKEEDAQRAAETRSIPDKIMFKHAELWKRKYRADVMSLQIDKSDKRYTRMLREIGIKQIIKNNEWESTAQVVEEMDVIISVDTSMLHLAGNLGKPTVGLLNKVYDWRWGRESDQVIWYPNQTLIMCSEMDDWDVLLGKVGNHLCRLNGK